MKRILTQIKNIRFIKNLTIKDAGYSQSLKWIRNLNFVLISSLSFGLVYLFSARIDEVVTANGELQSPGSERVIKSPFTGEILAVNIQEGQKVKAGQVLINLKTNKIDSEILQLKKKINSLKESINIKNRILSKFSEIYQAGAVSLIDFLKLKDELQKFESELAQKKVKLEELKTVKEDHKIITPIDGSVFELIPSSPGYFVNSGETLLQIIPNSKLEAKVFVQNRDIGFIKKHMDTEVRIDAYPFSTFGYIPGKVYLIGKESLILDKKEGQPKFPIYITLEKQNLEKQNILYPLKAGQTISVNLIVRDKPLINIITNVFGDSIDSIKNIKSKD